MTALGDYPHMLYQSETYELAKIHLITTGGTIEKTYDEADGQLENRESVIVQWLHSHLRLPHTQIHVHPLLAKDSLFMTDEDRSLIALTIQKIDEARPTAIVVSHGTDTMVTSALFCQEKYGQVSVPVIFTGAMKPLGFLDSDAVQNMTEALIACQLLPPGFYLSFHNRIFSPKKAFKNMKKKTFEMKN